MSRAARHSCQVGRSSAAPLQNSKLKDGVCLWQGLQCNIERKSQQVAPAGHSMDGPFGSSRLSTITRIISANKRAAVQVKTGRKSSKLLSLDSILG